MSVVNSVDALIHNCAKDVCGCEPGLQVVCNFSFRMSSEAFTFIKVAKGDVHFGKTFSVFQLLCAFVSSDKSQMFSDCSVIWGISTVFNMSTQLCVPHAGLMHLPAQNIESFLPLFVSILTNTAFSLVLEPFKLLSDLGALLSPQTPEELDDSDFETEDFDVRSRTSIQTEDDQLIAGQSARVRKKSVC